MPKEILVTGEAHPKQSEENLTKAREKIFRNFKKGLKLTVLKTYLTDFKEDQLKFVRSLFPPLYFIKENNKFFQDNFDEFTEHYEELFNYLQIVRESECDLLKRYRPDKIFVEDMNGREDLKKVAKSINAEIISYDRSGMVFLEKKFYEKYLLACLLLTAYSSKRSAAIIGNAHLEKAQNLLK